jgi:hypothetical protein
MGHVVLSPPKQKQAEREQSNPDAGDKADPVDVVRVGTASLDQSLSTHGRKDIAGQ